MAGLTALGDLGRAEGYAQTFIDGFPRDSYGYRMLGTIRARQQRLDEALELQQRGVELNEYDVEGRLHLGITLMQLDRLDEAEPHLAFAVDAWDGSPYAWQQWATLAEMQGRETEALRRFERVHHMDPGNAYTVERLDALLRARDDLPRLLEILLRTLDRVPDHLGALQRVGRVADQLDESEIACWAYWQLVTHYPAMMQGVPPYCPAATGSAP